MEKDVIASKRGSYLGCMLSPPCFPVHDEFQYSRIHHKSSKTTSNKIRGRRWRRILRRFMKESKKTSMCISGCGSNNNNNNNNKALSFQYDPISYAQNFDEEARRLSHVFQDIRGGIIFNSL
ncbi:hypothetical protein HN51_013488 [Arachis hypogaea]|nr:uncharacterized protein DS421_3g97310 [Arachis hypogaea]